MIGVLSDIHGNLPALQAALAMGAAAGATSWVCLGDVIDGGAWDNECARLLRDLAIPTVRGNHDEDRVVGIAADVRDFLLACPLSLEHAGAFMTHISPRRRARKVSDRYEAWNVFEDTAHRLIWLGHSHISMLWSQRCPAVAESREVVLEFGRTYALPADDRHIVSVGSLAYSRDSRPAPRFALWDPLAHTVVVHGVPVAPIATAAP